ncbi:MAG: ATP-binding cassette domain-containing protein [Candidatus Cloacimonadota bacterium]|nr:ATP-binding cassette domain-containing protein [Candidatus Cloacimonadota bacterium]
MHKKKKNLDSLINAVVALYLNLLRLDLRNIGKREVGIVYNIIKGTFSEKDIPPTQQIKKLIDNPFPLQKAVEVIKNYLTYPDKIKLLINLLLIAYMDDKFSTAERNDILEIVEMLEIDINIYTQIYELLEKKSNHIDIKLQYFTDYLEQTLFFNFLLIGNNTNCDIFFRHKIPYGLIILIIEDFVLVGSFQDSLLSIDKKELKKDRLYKLGKTEKICFSQPDRSHDKFLLSHSDILKLYENKKNETTRVIKNTKENFGFDIYQKKNRIRIKPIRGKIALAQTILIPERKYEIAINDYIIINDALEFSPLDILTENLMFRKERKLNKFYINYSEEFFHITEQKTSRSIAKINNEDKHYIIEPIGKNTSIFLNNHPVKSSQTFVLNRDILSVDHHSFRINKFFDIIKVDLEINHLQVNNLTHRFRDDNTIALDDISFDVRKNDFLAIMGPSGCGKTTLLNTLIGEIIPWKAHIEVDGNDLYDNFSYLKEYFGYVPQDDLLFDNLSVYENLYYCGRLRVSHIKNKDAMKKKIENILIQVGLYEKRNLVVGNVMDKKLSGGERKRLNIALELLSDPIIVVLDEPTSGLSSKDSEKIIEMLNDLKDQGKMIIATIHQPNPDMIQQFDKLLLLDNNGSQVFFGNTNEIFDYFDDELAEIVYGKDKLLRKKKLKMAEYIFDILQYPLLDSSGNPVYKQSLDDAEILEEQRQYSPEYWKTKFKKYQIYEIITTQEDKLEQFKNEKPDKSKFSHRKLNFKEKCSQFYFLLFRNIKSKLRNPTNLYVTFLAAPILAIIVSFILRYSRPEAAYSFAENLNIKIFIFISVIIFIFLGLSNSLDEIISEKRIILRENKLNIKTTFYLLTKNITLTIFALLQAILYFLISAFILQIKGIFWGYIAYLLLSSIIGFSLGLLASSLVKDKKAIINILPLVLIPQIILGGAVIEFEKMNRQFKLDPQSVIPEVVQLIPSRWLFEGLLVTQAKLNPYNGNLKKLNERAEKLREKHSKFQIGSKEFYKKRNEIAEKKAQVLKKYPRDTYVNKNINIAVNYMDGKYYNNNRNYFLASKKDLLGIQWNTYNLNIVIVVLFSIMINLLTYFSIQFYFNRKK